MSYTVNTLTPGWPDDAQYHYWWWPGNSRSQGISSNGIDLDLQEYSSLSTTRLKTFEAQTKWPKFGRWHFQMQFLEWNFLYYDSNFTEIYSYVSNKIWWLYLVPTSTTRFASDVGYRMAKKLIGLYKELIFMNNDIKFLKHHIPSQFLKTVLDCVPQLLF